MIYRKWGISNAEFRKFSFIGTHKPGPILVTGFMRQMEVVALKVVNDGWNSEWTAQH